MLLPVIAFHKAPPKKSESAQKLLLVPERNKRDEKFGLLNNIEMKYLNEGASLIYEATQFASFDTCSHRRVGEEGAGNNGIH